MDHSEIYYGIDLNVIFHAVAGKLQKRRLAGWRPQSRL
jgi:hypothetical protein